MTKEEKTTKKRRENRKSERFCWTLRGACSRYYNYNGISYSGWKMY